MNAAAVDLVTAIGANVAAVTLGTNGYHGLVRPPEDGYATKAVFCIEAGGAAASPDNGSTKRTVPAEVQVRTRGDKDDYEGGKDFTDAVFDFTEHASIAGYFNVRNLSATPHPMGTDAGGRYEWSYTVEMLYEAAT